MDSKDDNERLARYRQGDVHALEKLVEKYRRPLFGFILKMTDAQGDADEIFQETWIRAIRGVHRYRGDKLLSWLFRIARNLVIDRHRRRKPTEELVEDSDAYQHPAYGHPCASPDADACNKDLRETLDAAVSALPDAQREVFLMRMEADMPFKDIARIQHTSINTALARMRYAIGKLRAGLADDYAMLGRNRS